MFDSDYKEAEVCGGGGGGGGAFEHKDLMLEMRLVQSKQHVQTAKGIQKIGLLVLSPWNQISHFRNLFYLFIWF